MSFPCKLSEQIDLNGCCQYSIFDSLSLYDTFEKKMNGRLFDVIRDAHLAPFHRVSKDVWNARHGAEQLIF